MIQCPVLTAAQRQTADVIDQAEQVMMIKITRAIGEAVDGVNAQLKSLSSEETSPHFDYFAAVARRALFLKLCGADLESGLGGDPALAAAILDSDRKYAALHWEGKTIEEILAPTRTQSGQ